MRFEYSEDRDFFAALICNSGETIEKYASLFDFREGSIKRREFNGIRASVLKRFISEKGITCEWSFQGKCDINSGLNVDHLIPLSTNVLNKELRGLKAKSGRKVESQHFGSNHINNLVLSCSNCNAFKKHRLLTSEEIRRVLDSRTF